MVSPSSPRLASSSLGTTNGFCPVIPNLMTNAMRPLLDEYSVYAHPRHQTDDHPSPFSRFHMRGSIRIAALCWLLILLAVRKTDGAIGASFRSCAKNSAAAVVVVQVVHKGGDNVSLRLLRVLKGDKPNLAKLARWFSQDFDGDTFVVLLDGKGMPLHHNIDDACAHRAMVIEGCVVGYHPNQWLPMSHVEAELTGAGARRIPEEDTKRCAEIKQQSSAQKSPRTGAQELMDMLRSIEKLTADCMVGVSGIVQARIQIDPTGVVTFLGSKDIPSGTPTALCVANAFQSIRFRHTSPAPRQWTVPLLLRRQK